MEWSSSRLSILTLDVPKPILNCDHKKSNLNTSPSKNESKRVNKQSTLKGKV